MIEHVPTGDCSRCRADSFPPKCESNIEEPGLSGTRDHLLFISSTYCTVCQAVCLMAELLQVRGKQACSKQAKI